MLDYKILTFLKLCEVMNYRETARLLKMTQPAVTQHIKALEKFYNKKLFVYEKRKLYKTQAAKVLEEYSRSFYYNEQQLIKDLNKKRIFNLKIGATKSIEFILNEAIEKFLEDKNHTITLNFDNTENLLNLLEKSAIDIAFIEGNFQKSKFDTKVFRSEPFLGICGKNHKFAYKTVSLEEIFNETLLVREPGSGTRNIFFDLLKKKNISLNNFERVVCLNSFYTIKKLLTHEKGISFAYKSVADSNSNVAWFKIKNTPIFHDWSIVKLKNIENKYSDKLCSIFYKGEER